MLHPARYLLIVLADPYCYVYSAGGDLGRARAASRRGLLFSLFYLKPAGFWPDPLARIVTAILVQTPIPPQGASRGQNKHIFGLLAVFVF